MASPTSSLAQVDPSLSAAHWTDRLLMMLEISRAAASLDIPELIERVASSLHRSRWHWDHLSLCLPDAVESGLRVHHLYDAPGPLAQIPSRSSGQLIPIEGTQSGNAFSKGRPCVVGSKSEYAAMFAACQSPQLTSRILANLPPHYSSCAVPLVCRGMKLGTLAAASARDGAFDVDAVELLEQIADAIAPAIANALAYRQIEELKEQLARRNRYLEGEVNAAFGEIIGESPGLRRVMTLVESVAHTDSTVLIHGETGTGKELVARAIHRLSRRHNNTFVTLNCAAVPSALLESELFGHEKGAFTTAVSQRAGRFELARGGTLFLDEVGELPIEAQPKLLRVLQESEFERLGGTRTLKADARVVAATNRDLAEMIAERTFRGDLFHRLNVFPIFVPPLRERREDIPALARHFAALSARRLRKAIHGISPESLEALSRYDWPGNVRELANVIERTVILAPGTILEVGTSDFERLVGFRNLPVGYQPTPPPPPPGAPQRLAEAERQFITRALEETNWVVGGRSGAAQRLGLSRTTLQARMRKLGIVRPR